MKYSEVLKSNTTPEWRGQYLNYDLFKSHLKKFKKIQECSSIEHSFYEKTKREFEEFFKQALNPEVAKINEFHRKQREKNRTLWIQIQEYVSKNCDQPKTFYFNEKLQLSNPMANKTNFFRKTKKLICEFYLALKLLEKFAEMNQEGFRKILKKFDKIVYHDTLGITIDLKEQTGRVLYETVVQDAEFVVDKDTKKLIKEVEMLMIELENGDRSKAMSQLRVAKINDYPPHTVRLLGFMLGIMTMLFAVLVYFIVSDDQARSEFWQVFMRFRPGFYIWVFTFLIGMDIWLFRTFGVNYILIFEIDPRNHLSHQNIHSIAATLASLWFIGIILDLYTKTDYPVIILYGVWLVYLLHPFNFFGHRSSRSWLIRRGILRPFSFGLLPVIFTDFWFADQYNSLAGMFVDFNKVSCLIATDLMENTNSSECKWPNFGVGIFLALIPPAMRFGQCLRRYHETKDFKPHMWNAGKYSLLDGFSEKKIFLKKH